MPHIGGGGIENRDSMKVNVPLKEGEIVESLKNSRSSQYVVNSLEVLQDTYQGMDRLTYFEVFFIPTKSSLKNMGKHPLGDMVSSSISL